MTNNNSSVSSVFLGHYTSPSLSFWKLIFEEILQFVHLNCKCCAINLYPRFKLKALIIFKLCLKILLWFCDSDYTLIYYKVNKRIKSSAVLNYKIWKNYRILFFSIEKYSICFVLFSIQGWIFSIIRCKIFYIIC